MGNIVEYNVAPSEGISPSSEGVTAAREAAIGKERFARETGRAIGAGISDFGAPLQHLANEAERHTSFAQISHGAAIYSKLYGDLTQQWNQLAAQSDPNDTSVMQGFKEKVLEPALNKFRQAFESTTPHAQEWALGRSNSLGQHMTEKMIGDMGTRSGAAVHQNLGDIERNYSNIVLTDPSALRHIIDSLGTDVKAMISASPNITPAAAAKVESEMLPKMTERIATTAAYGMANSNPAELINAVNRGDFDKYLDGQEKQKAIKYAEGVQRAQKVDAEHQYVIAEREKKAAQEKEETLAVNKILTGQQLTGKEIAASTTLTSHQRTFLSNFQYQHTQQLREKKENTQHPEAYRSLLTGMFDQERADPNNLSIRPIREAFIRGEINPREEAELEQRFNGLNKPMEKNYQSQLLNAERAIKGSIMGKLMFDTQPEVAASLINRIDRDAYAKLNAEREKPGGNVNPLLDPNSKDYLFSPAVIRSYMQPPAATVAAEAAAVRAKDGGRTATGTIGAPPAPKVREFKTQAEAEKAGLTAGTRVRIDGRLGTWQ